MPAALMSAPLELPMDTDTDHAEMSAAVVTRMAMVMIRMFTLHVWIHP
jgi:hypothetical protein